MDTSRPHAVSFRVTFHVGRHSTHVTVVKVTDQSADRVLMRIKGIQLPMKAEQITSADPQRVVDVLVCMLADHLCSEAAGRSRRPPGGHGGSEPTSGGSQLRLPLPE